jgi:hypothetical protein
MRRPFRQISSAGRPTMRGAPGSRRGYANLTGVRIVDRAALASGDDEAPVLW